VNRDQSGLLSLTIRISPEKAVGLYRPTRKTLLIASSLRRHAQANAPGTSNWLRLAIVSLPTLLTRTRRNQYDAGALRCARQRYDVTWSCASMTSPTNISTYVTYRNVARQATAIGRPNTHTIGGDRASSGHTRGRDRHTRDSHTDMFIRLYIGLLAHRNTLLTLSGAKRARTCVVTRSYA